MSLTSTTPSPLTWTLRLKNHKTTVLLHVQSLLALSNLKEELLAVLNEITPDGLNDEQLPSSPSEILLAKPIDVLDISRGWEALEPSAEYELEDPFNIDEDEQPSKKGKGKKLESENLKAYGIKDNMVLAFRFKGDNKKGWDVMQATFTDEYGVENEGDMGVPKEFKG